ncbi:hypothetical protein [Herbaspirillum robiniae]|uniref:hypothetical protein n=1 Tax=Herbaspirillum robiniae TaxID=2014887 RepID=UPI003D77C16F
MSSQQDISLIEMRSRMYQRRIIPSRATFITPLSACCHKQDCGLNMGQLRMQISGESGADLDATQQIILKELREQYNVAQYFPEDMMSYEEQLSNMQEYIEDAGEYGLAYENIVSLLEVFPFKLSGLACVRLLEVGLLLGFKTESEKDKRFDRR